MQVIISKRTIDLLKLKIKISLLRKPNRFSVIRVIVFNIPIVKRIYSCIRGKKHTSKSMSLPCSTRVVLDVAL